MPRASKGNRWTKAAAFGSAKYDGEPEKDLWRTPLDLIQRLEATVGTFDLDAAASAGNAICPFYNGLDNGRDSLAGSDVWLTREDGRDTQRIFLNPPYSMAEEFLGAARDATEAAYAETQLIDIYVLVFARTDTRWWWQHVFGRDKNTRMSVTWPARQIFWIPGRVHFIHPDPAKESQGSPTPSVVVHLSSRRERAREWPENATF